MAYTVPTFNLTCNLFRYTGAAYVNLFNFPGNLQMGRRVPYILTGMTDGDNLPLSPYLLCPIATDVRDLSTGQAKNDVVEVPAGSGRWYGVLGVDDVAKGFPNEFRICVLDKIGWYAPWVAHGFTPWPSPIP